MSLSDFVKDMVMARKLHFGEGRFELLDLRGVILPTRTVAGMVEDFGSHMDEEDVRQVMFDTGRRQGKLAIEEVARENDFGRREYMEKMVASGNLMGLGKIEINRFKPGESHLEVEVSDMALVNEFESSRSFEDPGMPSTQFFRGLYDALCEEMFGQEVDVEAERTGDYSILLEVEA